MTDLTAAERYLLDQVQAGDPDGWTQLVQRFEGRLLSFARRRLPISADAEDVVQETFVSFLQSLSRFRGEASLETYLFGMLRRRIADVYRHRARVCSLADDATSDDAERSGTAPAVEPFATDASASWYVRQAETNQQLRDSLRGALTQVIGKLKDSLNFRDLRVCELLFYAQQRNKDIAARTQLDERQVALIKHRFLKRLASLAQVAEAEDLDDHGVRENAPIPEDLLTRVWEATRPSCPKRTTIGKFLMGTLDADWDAFVRFHLEELGCHFCCANRDDLREETESDESIEFRQRIFQSTVGFLRRE